MRLRTLYIQGDFITVLKLLKDVGVAFKDTGGAADEYKHVLRELESLVAIQQELQSLPATIGDVSQVNAIRGQAQFSLQKASEFLVQIRVLHVKGIIMRASQRRNGQLSSLTEYQSFAKSWLRQV